MKITHKIFNFFKYDFFIRTVIEVFQEVSFDAIVNIYFYDFSDGYEIFSMFLAVFFLSILVGTSIFIALFLLINEPKIRYDGRPFEKYS